MNFPNYWFDSDEVAVKKPRLDAGETGDGPTASVAVERSAAKTPKSEEMSKKVETRMDAATSAVGDIIDKIGDCFYY